MKKLKLRDVLCFSVCLVGLSSLSAHAGLFCQLDVPEEFGCECGIPRKTSEGWSCEGYCKEGRKCMPDGGCCKSERYCKKDDDHIDCCKDGEYCNTSGTGATLCQACGGIENCQTYTSPGGTCACKKCNDGYEKTEERCCPILEDPNCDKVFDDVTGCYICQSCAIENCAECSADGTTCVQCDDGYQVNNGQCMDSECVGAAYFASCNNGAGYCADRLCLSLSDSAITQCQKYAAWLNNPASKTTEAYVKNGFICSGSNDLYCFFYDPSTCSCGGFYNNANCPNGHLTMCNLTARKVYQSSFDFAGDMMISPGLCADS